LLVPVLNKGDFVRLATRCTLRCNIVLWAAVCLLPRSAPAQELVTDLRITTLSTMLTELRGVGEWGYAALVETNQGTFLFDTGERPDTVLGNAGELGIDLGAVEGLRAAADLTRETSVVGAVGTVFTLDKGIQAGMLNR
jgi:hypothetical protein